MRLKVNGEVWMDIPVELNVNDSNWLAGYRHFLEQTGFLRTPTGESLDVDPETWARALNLYVYQVTPYAAKLDVVPEVGRIDIELIFRVATPNTLNLVLLAQKNSRLQLWGNGNVMYQAEP